MGSSGTGVASGTGSGWSASACACSGASSGASSSILPIAWASSLLTSPINSFEKPKGRPPGVLKSHW